MLKMAKLKDLSEVTKFHSLIEQSLKLVSSRTNDLLDQGLIEQGAFVPNESYFAPNHEIRKIAQMLRT